MYVCMSEADENTARVLRVPQQIWSSKRLLPVAGLLPFRLSSFEAEDKTAATARGMSTHPMFLLFVRADVIADPVLVPATCISDSYRWVDYRRQRSLDQCSVGFSYPLSHSFCLLCSRLLMAWKSSSAEARPRRWRWRRHPQWQLQAAVMLDFSSTSVKCCTLLHS